MFPAGGMQFRAIHFMCKLVCVDFAFPGPFFGDDHEFAFPGTSFLWQLCGNRVQACMCVLCKAVIIGCTQYWSAYAVLPRTEP